MMGFDPSKFFIGLTDFFSILLPGALLTWLLMDEVGPAVLGDRYANLDATLSWAVFLFASYLLGHLVFLLGSWLDEFYDWARRYTLNRQIRQLALRGTLLPWFARFLVWLVFRNERNLALRRAEAIKDQELRAVKGERAINTFQWCKVVLSLDNRQSLSVVQRFEADSKFFRSFTILLLLVLCTWPLHNRWPPVGFAVALALLLLALWRYMEQRNKATNQAYWSVITLRASTKTDTPVAAPPAEAGPTHAGGVVYRRKHGRIEIVLVEAKDDPKQWVLPKGRIEPHELPRETAVREVREETGTWARIVDELPMVTYTVKDKPVTVQFYLMEALVHGRQKDAFRKHAWFAYPLQAFEEEYEPLHDETRQMLEAARPRLATPADHT